MTHAGISRYAGSSRPGRVRPDDRLSLHHHDGARTSPVDELIVIPDLSTGAMSSRTHLGEPHQVDLWRLRSIVSTTDDDMDQLITLLVDRGVRPDSPRRPQQRGARPEPLVRACPGHGAGARLMLRKGIPDIRYLCATEPRMASQMQDLRPWRPVSMLPPITRDMSVVVGQDIDERSSATPSAQPFAIGSTTSRPSR